MDNLRERLGKSIAGIRVTGREMPDAVFLNEAEVMQFAASLKLMTVNCEISRSVHHEILGIRYYIDDQMPFGEHRFGFNPRYRFEHEPLLNPFNTEDVPDEHALL